MFKYLIPFLVAGVINIRKMGYEFEIYKLKHKFDFNPFRAPPEQRVELRIYRNPNYAKTPYEKMLYKKSNICSLLTYGIIIGTIIVYAAMFYLYIQNAPIDTEYVKAHPELYPPK